MQLFQPSRVARFIPSVSRFIPSIAFIRFGVRSFHRSTNLRILPVSLNYPRCSCIDIMARENRLISSTMRSLTHLLDKIDNTLQQSKSLQSEYSDDLQKFFTFIHQYNVRHYAKEKILNYIALTNIHWDVRDSNYPLICNMNEEDDYIQKLYELTVKKFTVTDGYDDEFVTNQETPSKSSIDSLCKHMDEEHDVVYPMILRRFSQKQINKVCQTLDEIDSQNMDIINSLECLSNELIEKYD